MEKKSVLQKIESYIIKITIIQFGFLILAQTLINNKVMAPYFSRTLFSEGVFIEYVVKVVQLIDQAPSL